MQINGYDINGAISKHAFGQQMAQSNSEKLTLRENIEQRIRFHEAEILNLRRALDNITSKPLSEVTIGDLNLAMRS